MGSALRNPHMPIHLFTPEKYQKNAFTAGCYFYIKKEYDKTQQWLTFKRFLMLVTEPNLKQCRETVFTDTLNMMKTDYMVNGGWSKGSAEPLPVLNGTPPEGLPKPHKKFIKEGATNLGDAIIDGLRTAQKKTQEPAEPKKDPGVLALRRQEAEAWILAHLDAGFGVFKAAFPEPDFETSWFMAARSRLLAPKEELAAKTELKFNMRTTEPIKKVCRRLLTLSPSRIREIRVTELRDVKGLFTGSTAQNYSNWVASAKRIVLKHLEGGGGRVAQQSSSPAQAANAILLERPPKQRKSRTVAASTMPTKAFIPLAEIPLEEFKCSTADLKKIAERLVVALHPRGSEARIVLLSDPPVMEIRVPA